jgi:hypothetical protein
MLTAIVCVALSGAGLALALLTAWRHRFLAATRLLALALLPIGLYLAGLATLGARIGGAVGSWGAGLVFNPAVWLGFMVLALAAVLYLAARFVGQQGKRKAAAGREKSDRSGAAAPSAAALDKSASTGGRSGKSGRTAGDDLSDFADVKEILRKRGI